MIIGPMTRAGLIAEDVAGPTTMMMANTAKPMTRPAKPGVARLSITPNTVNTKMNVPMPSANMARPAPTECA